MERCGNYFIEDGVKIGRGGFGEVFEVKVYNLTKTSFKTFAIKYFSPTKKNNTSAIKAVADLNQRFTIEIKTQCKLNGLNYDSIAPIVLFSLYGEKPYFIMEKAEFNLLKSIEFGMDENEKNQAVKQILSGLKTIHDNNYIHRDLKPENILKYKDGKYKITDFGLVKDLDSVRAEIKTRFEPNDLGSDGYRAPEITISGLFTKQSDIYAMGQIISDIYVSNRSNQKIKKIISKCREYWPEDRYFDSGELLADFIKALEV